MLLGRTYGIRGHRSTWDAAGAEMGWPTANLRLPADRVVPPDGVYAARTGPRCSIYDAIAYIEPRPTLERANG